MVGSTLRAAREKLGLTVEDIANETSIRAAYIEAIEKSDNDSLPSEVYVKGFIRNYAEMLHLDGDALAREYHEEIHGADEPPAPEVKPVADASRGPFSSGSDFHERVEKSHRTQNLIIVAAVIVIAFVGAIYYFFGDGGALAPKQEAAKPQTTVTTSSNNGKNNNNNVQNTTPAQNAASNNASSKNNGAANNATANVSSNAANGLGNTQATAQAAAAGPVQVSAHFTGRCWVEIVSDGDVVFEGTVESGKTMNWSGKERITMTAGNAGAVDVTYNGKNLGKLGKEGDVIEKRFTKDKAEDVK
ncbi:MAG: helix-turn-helix domain-containing protein [Selenomonadaceae bacterium]